MIGTCRAETLRCTVRRGLWAANSRGTLIRDVLGHLCLSLTGAALRHPKCKTPKGESSTHQRRTSHTKVYQCKHTHTPPHTHTHLSVYHLASNHLYIEGSLV